MKTEILRNCLKTAWVGKNLVCFDETDSTNIQAARLARGGCPDGTLVVSDCQTAGRGRQGRSWLSPHGSSIYMSLVLRPQLPPRCASAVTLIAGLAVACAVCKKTGLAAGIKWPNDVVVDGRKICGILTEMSVERNSIHHIVTGIGINVNQQEFPKELSATATSIRLASGRSWNRASLAAAVLQAFEGYYAKFLQTGDLSLLKEEYEKRLVNLNTEVLVLDPSGAWQGICRGISRDGGLFVECTDGQRKTVRSGEVSVRGVYGYV